jgi:hypothetical protein
MQAGVCIALGIQLHHSAHLPSVFSRDAGGIDTDRIQIVCLDLRPEAGRAIVCQGDSIDDKLRLVLRPAWMQHRVALIEPSGLRVYEILHRPSRQRTKPAVNLLLPDLHHGRRTIGIDQGCFLCHPHC